MSSTTDSIVKAAENLVSPIYNQKYSNGVLLVLLLLTANYYAPHPLLPVRAIQFMKDNKYVGVVFVLLFSYLLIKDMRVAMATTLVIYALNYMSENI